ncbi:MAG: hypothetical protein ABI318_22710 [Chthoniobacteraceae bacterium]
MSDSNLGKKMVEEQHLSYFLGAYRTVTGIGLTVSSNGESPDFICARTSGELVGVELARSPHNHQLAVNDRIWTDRTMESYDLLGAITGIITAKERKRRSPHWRTPHNTILVIELLDYSFKSLYWTDDSSLSDDYSDAGFIEIWLSDHSTLEPFGVVRLIGLYPRHFWGVHPRSALEGKPYG